MGGMKSNIVSHPIPFETSPAQIMFLLNLKTFLSEFRSLIWPTQYLLKTIIMEAVKFIATVGNLKNTIYIGQAGLLQWRSFLVLAYVFELLGKNFPDSLYSVMKH